MRPGRVVRQVDAAHHVLRLLDELVHDGLVPLQSGVEVGGEFPGEDVRADERQAREARLVAEGQRPDARVQAVGTDDQVERPPRADGESSLSTSVSPWWC
ncbi:hypothetical protein [Amycolatopsis sp. NPDC051071]|uniref:hypothetical protein n=1 Tax=Amycolatopsis sp. NPDC051071 TaxID=3154637 RepID=UPI0034191134